MSAKKNLTKEQVEELLSQLDKGKTKQELFKEYNVSYKTFDRIAKDYNIDQRNYRCKQRNYNRIKNRPDINKEWLIENWVNSNKSLKELSLECGLNESCLWARASRWGLEKHYKHYVNVDKFKNLMDVNVWYVAGLVATDGHLHNKVDRVDIRLTGYSERILLQSILDYFEVKDNVDLYLGKNNEIRISFKGVCDFYKSNFNIPRGNKTFSVGVPSYIPNEDCAKAYIRGCLDGDGCFPKTSNRVRVRLYCASLDLVVGIINIINHYVNLNIKLDYMKGTTINNKSYPGFCLHKSATLKLLDWVYSLDNCFRLERKYESYKLMR